MYFQSRIRENEIMKKYLIINLLIMCCLCANAQQKVIDLSGKWHFQIDKDNKGIAEEWFKPDFLFNDNIQLPGSMPERMKGDDITVNTQWTGGLYDSSYYRNPFMEKYRVEGNVKVPFFLTPQKYYVGKAWYKKTFIVDQTWHNDIVKGKKVKREPVRYKLFLERPHTATRVWINDKELTTADTESTVEEMFNSLSIPHVYYINGGNLKEGENTITVCVDNRLDVANVGKDSHSVTDQTQGNWNGIVGQIELREETYIDTIKVYPDVDNRKVLVHLALMGSNFISDCPAKVTLTVESFNTAKRHIIVTEPRTVKLPDDEPTTLDITIDMGDEMLLWDEHCPQMYRLTAEVETKNRKTTDETYFGMRKIEARGKTFYVNNKPVQLRGTVENCCFPLTGYPPTDLDSWLKIFQTCKEWGLNHMRFHSYCPPEAAFLAADLTGFYIQPEGPSWPNHGVRLGRGEFIDKYLYEEAKRIMDTYGNHPSFTFFAFGNEPAGNWVKWSNENTPRIAEYDPRHINSGFSVGGGWAWQPKVQYAVKAGARGLDSWNRTAPESTENFYDKVHTYNGKDMPGTPITIPFVSHETGQWCAFPNLEETKKYTGVNKAYNFDIFRDMLKENGMEKMASKFLWASGKLQALCYKYEIERHLRTPEYEGFQLLSLNDYSGQGTALVGVTDVFWDSKGYISAPEWREFCSDIVPLAKIKKFTYTTDETFEANIELSQFSGEELKGVSPKWEIRREPKKQGPIMTLQEEAPFADGTFVKRDLPQGQNIDLGSISVPLSSITESGKYTLSVSIPGTKAYNHWDFWVYTSPTQVTVKNKKGKREGTYTIDDIYVTDSLDAQAQKILKKGGKVLICAAGKVTYGREVKQQFTPVFWNTSWFKMRPPHTTGVYVENTHPVFNNFPTENHSDLQWWELVNKAQVMQFTDFPEDFQPLVQNIDTWFVSRKIGMLFEARVGNGRLMMTTMDITKNLDKRIVARQMRQSIIQYMKSAEFQPKWTIDQTHIQELFTKVAGEVNMYTNDSPDELKPKLK